MLEGGSMGARAKGDGRTEITRRRKEADRYLERELSLAK